MWKSRVKQLKLRKLNQLEFILLIIFYSMFELCKKVEVYNIENNYYYFQPNPIKSQIKQNLGLHLLKAGLVSSITTFKANAKPSFKKGIALSKTMDASVRPTSQSDVSPVIDSTSISKKIKVAEIQSCQLKNKYNDQFSRLRTDIQSNQNMISCLYSRQSFKTPNNQSAEKKQKSHIQKITTKSKPINASAVESITNYTSPQLQRLISSTQAETIKNLSDTRPPISSKIQSCTHQDAEIQNIQSLHEPEINVPMRQSFENSSSKLITISKSVSSFHETINEREYRRLDLESEQNSRSGKQISINLSNIFSKEDPSQFRKSHRETMKRLSLWQDIDRFTIQSRLSRDHQFIEDQDVKIQQSFICDHDIKSNFKILEPNQIRKKDFVTSQAIESNINFLVSLKQFLSHDYKIVADEIQIHEIIEKDLKDKECFNNILQLYQVQRSENSYLFIKEPYQIPLQAKIKQSGEQQKKVWRQKAKQKASAIIDQLQHFSIYPCKKITIHQFVLCMDQPKIHDLSVFKYSSKQILPKEDVLAGLDI